MPIVCYDSYTQNTLAGLRHIVFIINNLLLSQPPALKRELSKLPARGAGQQNIKGYSRTDHDHGCR